MNLKEVSKLSIGPSVMLLVSDVLNMGCFLKFTISYSARVMRVRKSFIIFFFENTKFTDILKSFVHPATSTSIVVIITVNQLLN